LGVSSPANWCLHKSKALQVGSFNKSMNLVLHMEEKATKIKRRSKNLAAQVVNLNL